LRGTRDTLFWAAVFATSGTAGACAPAVARMTMLNPANTTAGEQATQSYDLPPFQEDHHYEATLAAWTPSALTFRIHFVNSEGCGLPSSYVIDLLDDQGRRYSFAELQKERATRRPGHLGARLFDATVEGTFPVSVGGSTRYVILEVRPRADRACTALDLRWDFTS
jgi:hypothetical protein